MNIDTSDLNNKQFMFDIYYDDKNLYKDDINSFNDFLINYPILFEDVIYEIPLIIFKNNKHTEGTIIGTVTEYLKINPKMYNNSLFNKKVPVMYKSIISNVIFNITKYNERIYGKGYKLVLRNFNLLYKDIINNSLKSNVSWTLENVYFTLVDQYGNQVYIPDEYISWEEYFMGVASLSALRSKDPKTKVGACIVRDNKILSMGYNGFPIGCDDDNFSWESENEDPLKVKDSFVVHSELNAILNYKGDLTGSVIYVTMFPCNECVKAIIQSGIKGIVYKDEYSNSTKVEASKMMLRDADLWWRKYEETGREEIIKF